MNLSVSKVLPISSVGGHYINTTDFADRIKHILTGLQAAMQDERSRNNNNEVDHRSGTRTVDETSFIVYGGEDDRSERFLKMR